MKYSVEINNVPKMVKPYIVARVIEGELWFWGSWDNEETAHLHAIEIDGIVVYAEEL